MKKWIKILIFLIIVVLLILGAVRLVHKKKEKEASIPIAKEYALLVKTMIPSKKEISLSIPYIALVKNDGNTVISSKFPARVLYIKKEGSKVKKGEIVAKIDSTLLQSKLSSLKSQISSIKEAINAVKTNLSNLYNIHERTKKLLKVKGASIEQSEREESQIASAKAKLSELKAKFSTLKSSLKEIQNEMTYAILKSPIEGIVAKKFVNAGDLAMPGHPVIKINSNKGSYLLVRVPKDTKIYSVIYKDKEFAAKPLNSTFNSLNEYRVDVNDPNLIEGERVDIKVVNFKGQGILLPQDAILNRDGKNYVLIVKKDKAFAKKVSIKASSQKGVVINEDISDSKIVVAKADILLKLLSGIKLKEIKE